jgi:hypothetical protein
MGSMQRRTFILSAVSAGFVALAGCSEDGGGTGGNGNGNTSDGGLIGNGNGGNGNGNTGNGNSGNGNGSMGSGDVQYEDSFVMEYSVEGSEATQEVEMTVHVNGANSKMIIEAQQNIEAYFVDGDAYQVIAGQCFKNPGEFEAPDVGPSPGPGDQYDPTVDLPEEYERTETIDGETMRVYEFDPENEELYGGPQITVYVSDETGYLSRVEGEEFSVEYHSWGQVDPIEKPDMDCQEISGGDGDYP